MKRALVTPSFGVEEVVKSERRETGVGFMVKTALVDNLAGPPKGLNDRVVTMKLPHSYGREHATIVSAYGPTMTNPEDVMDKFY